MNSISIFIYTEDLVNILENNGIERKSKIYSLKYDTFVKNNIEYEIINEPILNTTYTRKILKDMNEKFGLNIDINLTLKKITKRGNPDDLQI